MDLIQFLNYGAAGFCAILSILCWRLIAAEQKRSQNPRKAILQTCYVFMGFCLVLSGLTTTAELRKNTGELQELKDKVKDYDTVKNELDDMAVKCATAEAHAKDADDMVAFIKENLLHAKGLAANEKASSRETMEKHETQTAATARPKPVGSPSPVAATVPMKPAAQDDLTAVLDKMLVAVNKVSPVRK
jgi:hypothetical protein